MSRQYTAVSLPWGWIGFFSAILLLAIISSYALLSAGRQFAKQELPEQSVLRILLEGNTYLLPQQAQPRLAVQATPAIQEQLSQVKHQTEQQLQLELDRAFAPVYAQLPLFIDWYYSLGAEYLRYAHALNGDISQHLQQQFSQTVLQPAQLAQAIDSLPATINRQLYPLLAASHQTIADHIRKFATEHIVSYEPRQLELSGQLDMDSLLLVEPQLIEQQLDRQLISALVGAGIGISIAKGIGSLMVKKVLAKIAGSASFEAAGSVLSKLAMKSAVKGGSTLGATATGLVLCSPGGPGALLCGAVAGIAAWVAMDSALISLDELLNREEFTAELHELIGQQQQHLAAIYSEAYSAMLSAHFATLKQEIAEPPPAPGSFVPVETLKGIKN